MTVEEKKKAIKDHCNNMKGCMECPLNVITDQTHTSCYATQNYELIERNYEILFGKESEETEEQNVPAEPKITLRELLNIVEVPVAISEDDFGSYFMILNQLDCYGIGEFTHMLSPEFLDREVYRMKTQDNNILVALKEVE